MTQQTAPANIHNAAIAALSQWIDDNLATRDSETITLHRTMKVGEEAGEVVAAVIGWTGANPRKGKTHRSEDVIAELLDVAVTALGAVEHLTGNVGHSRALLDEKILTVANRADVMNRYTDITGRARRAETTLRGKLEELIRSSEAVDEYQVDIDDLRAALTAAEVTR